jgi:hypothetical protein
MESIWQGQASPTVYSEAVAYKMAVVEPNGEADKSRSKGNRNG